MISKSNRLHLNNKSNEFHNLYTLISKMVVKKLKTFLFLNTVAKCHICVIFKRKLSAIYCLGMHIETFMQLVLIIYEYTSTFLWSCVMHTWKHLSQIVRIRYGPWLAIFNRLNCSSTFPSPSIFLKAKAIGSVKIIYTMSC